MKTSSYGLNISNSPVMETNRIVRVFLFWKMVLNKHSLVNDDVFLYKIDNANADKIYYEV